MTPTIRRVLFLSLVSLVAFAAQAHAQVRVRGYLRDDGTYVGSHYRSAPDGNPYNNWSYPGNVNPHTGEIATGDPNRYLEQYQNRNGSGYDPHSNNPTTYNPYTAYRW